ncbi:MAG TPA: BMP family ABC transporter substrate-binding protein [Pseudothermotoga sp.]|nr:BMP family ABC transporter substrate-binding protein [Pseudothermotoga sp.]HOK83034.1 BMP family ABC transporter substrate-binding protein [Pseudothermotoga sp.]HPP69795.1 BMP family ABC transporter substrate-binding protein [Pseudothermotoga sp.]
MKKILVLMIVVLSAVVNAYSVALLITGEVGGNAIYEMMVQGAVRASKDFGFDVKVIEGGYNSSKWEPLLISLASTKSYDLIVTFTEGMPKSVEKAAKMFPQQKFALIDGIAPNLANVYSLGFKDEEMAYLAGYFAGLITKSNLPGANSELKIGMIAGDIYPAMTEKMKPAYEKGAKSADEKTEIFFSVAGSWADPNKGYELAQLQFSQGVDVIFLVAGGTGIGAIKKAKELGRYVIGVDSNVIYLAPDVILACVLKRADMAIYEVLKKAYLGKLPLGHSERWGIREGAIGFTFDDPSYLQNVPEQIREKMIDLFEKVERGEITPFGD